MSAAAVWDIVIEQGADWRPSLGWFNDDGSPIDLTSYIARMQVRPDYESPTVLVDISSASGIALGSDGSISPVITAGVTQGLTYDPNALPRVKDGRQVFQLGVYDIRVQSPTGEVTKLYAGAVFLAPGVTVGA